MRTHRNITKSRALIGAMIVLGSLSCATPSFALLGIGGVMTYDPKSISQLMTQVQTTKNQLTQLTSMKGILQQQLSSIGNFGVMGDLFNGSSFKNVGSSSDFYKNIKKFAFDPCAINLCTVGQNPVGTTDISQALDWVQKNYYSSTPLNPATTRDLTEVRRRAIIYSATNAEALATVTHNALAGSGDQAKSLEQIVQSSTSLRGDIRANSAIALAAYKIQVEQLAMLTALVDVDSSTAISNTSVYYENGGTKFPNAFIDSDYSGADLTHRIKVTAPTKGSAGGVGFGGGLIGAALAGNGLGGPVGSLLSSGGSGNIASLLTGSSPISGLVKGVSEGALPNVDPASINMGSLLGDAAGMTANVLGNSGKTNLQSAMNLVQNGLASNSTSGNSLSLLGLAQAFAGASGNTNLLTALNTGAQALNSNDTNGAINFARGAISDLEKTGTQGKYVNYLNNEIASLQSGKTTVSNLVLDTSAILSHFGTTPNSQAAAVLQIDPTKATPASLQASIAAAMKAIAQATNDKNLEAAANGVASLSPSDVASLQTKLAAADATQTTTTSAAAQP